MEITNKLLIEYPALYNAALKEFSEYFYDKASLNRILKNAEMSKGSFYYNIGDKYKLYLMLMSCMAYRKIENFKEKYYQKALPEDFFDSLLFILSMNLDMMYDEPMLAKFHDQINKEDQNFMLKIYKEFPTNDVLYWNNMIDQAIEKGQIRNDVPKEVITSFMVEGLLKLIGPRITSDITKEEALKLISNYIILVRDAVSAKKISKETL
jgi:AcrR family transcriptional regulator